MLKELNIKNYALIDHLQINFANGFSVITGETGSGKSIMLGALALILGERADMKSIRDKDQKCVVEGIFEVKNDELQNLFLQNDLDFETELIIRREINAQGKSRAFVNDSPVSLHLLKEISEKLLDIHSQHETLLLNDKSFVFEIIDSQLGNKNLKLDYTTNYQAFKSLDQQLNELLEKEKQSQQDKNFYQFLLSEFDEINLDEAIESNIEEEHNLLLHAEEIKSSLTHGIQLLSGADYSIISNLQTLRSQIEKISHLNANIGGLYERIVSSTIELEDIEAELSKMESNIDVDNQRLMSLEKDISKLHSLQRKHNCNSLLELKNKKQELEEALAAIGTISDEIEAITKQKVSLTAKLNTLATEISKARKSIIPDLEDEAKGLLSKMKMKNAEIKFSLTSANEFNAWGKDAIELLAKTNLGGSLESLKKIASGGESSRIMLAIKSLQTQNISLPTIIFDEIDTGVSGEVATHMGEIMKDLGHKMQVISITHLPQIASKGTHHFKVFKEEANKTTLTKIVNLSHDERITEIAQMLSSNQLSQAAIDNAKELLLK